MSASSWKEPCLISYVSIRTDFMLLSLLDGALSRTRGTDWPARERVPARGLSGLRWNQRMGPDGSDPRAVDLCPTGGDRFPSSVRLSPIVTTGWVPGSFAVLEEVGSMTDRTSCPP